MSKRLFQCHWTISNFDKLREFRHKVYTFMGDEPFEEKMQRLTVKLNEQFAENAKLEAAIRENLRRLGL